MAHATGVCSDAYDEANTCRWRRRRWAADVVAGQGNRGHNYMLGRAIGHKSSDAVSASGVYIGKSGFSVPIVDIFKQMPKENLMLPYFLEAHPDVLYSYGLPLVCFRGSLFSQDVVAD